MLSEDPNGNSENLTIPAVDNQNQQNIYRINQGNFSVYNYY